MSRTFIFLTLLIVSSFCIEKNQNNVNEIIDELMELNSLIPNKAMYKKGDRSVKTLVHIQKVARKETSTFQLWYGTVQRNCKAGTQYLSGFAAKLKGDLARARSASVRASANQNRVRELSMQLGHANLNLERSKERVRRETAVYRRSRAEAHNKLMVIRHVRNIVVDELLNGKAPASLIQVNTINEKLQALKTMIEKDNDPMFSSMVETLLEMATMQNLNDQSTLKKLIASLNSLSQKLRSWLKSSKVSHKRIRMANRAAHAAMFKSINAYGKLIADHATRVVAAKRAVEEFNNSIFVLTRALQRKHKEGHVWTQLCEDQARVAGTILSSIANVKKHARAAWKAKLNAGN
jgi:hypothetical protein